MTLVKSAGSITESRGSTGGNVSKRDMYGQHLQRLPRRIRRAATKPQREVRIAYRIALSSFFNMLSQWERDLWNVYAKLNPVKNKLGEDRTLTPQSAFLKINIPRLLNGLPTLKTPPR